MNVIVAGKRPGAHTEPGLAGTTMSQTKRLLVPSDRCVGLAMKCSGPTHRHHVTRTTHERPQRVGCRGHSRSLRQFFRSFCRRASAAISRPALASGAAARKHARRGAAAAAPPSTRAKQGGSIARRLLMRGADTPRVPTCSTLAAVSYTHLTLPTICSV